MPSEMQRRSDLQLAEMNRNKPESDQLSRDHMAKFVHNNYRHECNHWRNQLQHCHYFRTAN